MHSSVSAQLGICLRDVLPHAEPVGPFDLRVRSVCASASQCQPGDLFVAITGSDHDGHDAVDEAVARGAIGVVGERLVPVAVPKFLVDDSREAYGELCHALAEYPAEQLTAVGITGSYGKTAVAVLLGSILEEAEQGVGMTCSLGYSDGLQTLAGRRSTPGTAELADWLRRMSGNGCQHAVVEVSSQALAERRTAGIAFDAAILTNLRREHLDFHGSERNLRRAKARLFRQLKPHGFAIINGDDPHSHELLPSLRCPTLVTGIHAADCDVRGELLERHPGEQTFLMLAGDDAVPVRTRLIGDHHIRNCLQAAATALVLGIDLQTIVRGLESVERLPRRLEPIDLGTPFQLYLDCATSADNLAQTLHAVRQVTSGRVLCVYGADPESPGPQRALLGAAAERAADVSVVTTLQTTERPLQIIHDVLDGYDRVARAMAIPDRRKAVRWALAQAKPGDAVVVAGARDTHGDAGHLAQEDQRAMLIDLVSEAAAPECVRQAPVSYPIWNYRR